MKPDFEPTFHCRAFEFFCVVAGLGWLLLICALGAGAALVGWQALDRWCERQLTDE
jgi:hypothetical protein